VPLKGWHEDHDSIKAMYEDVVAECSDTADVGQVLGYYGERGELLYEFL